MEEKELLTDEQLWLLCEEEENKKKSSLVKNDSRDKGIDWDYEQMIWNKWGNV
jgi:hypothetical protein